MKLLIIEDEPTIRKQLENFCRTNKYVSESAEDGEEGLYLGTEFNYDLAIIDLGLPKLDGISLIKQLREQKKTFPILILTARNHWQEKVEGLECGADDYLVKPFHEEELRARVHALIRRSSGNTESTLVFDSIEIDTTRKTVHVEKAQIELTGFEYNTLEYLVLNKNRPVSKTELTEHLYHQDFERDSNVIEVFVGRLRKKLDPENTVKPIKTVRGLGYRFSLEQK